MIDDEMMADDIAVIDAAIDTLTCHFENITIFASRHDPSTGNTLSTWRGRGNWHARHGHVREWLIKQDEQARIEMRAEAGEGE